ncbi:hypothetical protein B0A52_02102 [Exophiala mesophila]|uniref:Enoyl reductase (ER) domain-containing protein n=1 Tax=Exophiala mesophila TaxID=212818 RepID=A0A438NEZ2_EXOME|nr:hypothetical protein B0A52_02102 [Exophiala mesophila]
MQALHLPGVQLHETPAFTYPHKQPPPSVLVFSSADFPEPQPRSTGSESDSPSQSTPAYLIRVLTTALTRGELTWPETLAPSRFHPYGSAIPGHDVVGIIQKVYPSTSTSQSPKFNVGDKVWALIDFDRDGAAATLTVAHENELSLIPDRPSTSTVRVSRWDELLATVPLSGLTAYQAMFIHGGLPRSSLNVTPSPSHSPSSDKSYRILVLGAAGSVGVPALSLAHSAGFHVTAVCSSPMLSFVSETLHADKIIQYPSPDFTSIPDIFSKLSLEPVDLVLDCTGATLLLPILSNPKPVIREKGRVVTIVAPVEDMVKAAAPPQTPLVPDIPTKFFIVRPSGSDLDILSKLIAQDRLQMHTDKVFGLEQGREAMELVESRGRRNAGKVVIRVAEE